MTHDEFVKKYNPVPASSTWITKAIMDPNFVRPTELLAVVVIDGSRVPGIILTDKENGNRFYKMNPYVRGDIIDFDIIDKPYTPDQFEFIDEDFTMDVLNSCVSEIMGDKFPMK